MKPDNRLFDDLSRVAGGAMNVFSGICEQILKDVKARVDDAASRMDLVPREDFDRLQLQVNALQKRLDDLTGGASKKPAAKKAPTKKSAKKKA